MWARAMGRFTKMAGYDGWKEAALLEPRGGVASRVAEINFPNNPPGERLSTISRFKEIKKSVLSWIPTSVASVSYLLHWIKYKGGLREHWVS